MTALRCILIFFSFFFLMIQKAERVCLADKPPLWESTWLIIWKTLCHFSWLNKIDWIFEFYDKVTLACLKWPSRESAALSLSMAESIFCPLQIHEWDVSSSRKTHSVTSWWQYLPTMCTSVGKCKASEHERKSFLSISHHVIEQWGILSLHSCGDGVFKLN